MLLRVTDPRSDPVPSMLNSPSPPPLNRFILFEDQDLLVTEKPAGLNTHAPSPFAGEGFYDWLRHREPRWSSLAIVHRLDKETSGVLVFGKTPLANRSLTEQFTRHGIRKKYLFLAGHRPDQEEIVAVSALVRTGDKYVSRPLHAGAERAETRFRVVGSHAGNTLVEAEPVTGKTHQIRVHAAEHGFPIIGDVLYGGAPGPRVLLHAGELTLRHPATGEPMTFQSSVAFGANHRQQLRAAIIEAPKTNAFRLVHGASDGWPGWYVDRLGDFVLSQAEADCSEKQRAYLEALSDVAGVYHKRLERRIGRAAAGEVSPQFVFGKPAPERFTVKENGVLFELSFQEGYSAGLFLDQRDNRRRFLVNHVAAAFPLFEGGAGGREVLNTFAYTCGFSVCAALAGHGSPASTFRGNTWSGGNGTSPSMALIRPPTISSSVTPSIGCAAWKRNTGSSTPSCSTRQPSRSRSNRASFARIKITAGWSRRRCRCSSPKESSWRRATLERLLRRIFWKSSPARLPGQGAGSFSNIMCRSLPIFRSAVGNRAT
jgi:RluA family pseudouridine synthase